MIICVPVQTALCPMRAEVVKGAPPMLRQPGGVTQNGGSYVQLAEQV